MEVQKINPNQNKDEFIVFYGKLSRHLKVGSHLKTNSKDNENSIKKKKLELKVLFFDLLAILGHFIEEDYDYAFKGLLRINEGYAPTTGQIYQLCEESENSRRKKDRSNQSQILIDYEKSVPLSKVEASEVWQNALKVADGSKSNASTHPEEKEDVQPQMRLGKSLYEYYRGEYLNQVSCYDHVDEVLFKKACKDKLYKTPHTVKFLYSKTEIIEGFLTSRICEKNDFAEKITVGYF